MKILDRYVVREFIAPLALSISAFIIIMLSGQLFMLVDFIVQKKVPVLVVVRMLIYSLPGIIVEAGPIAMLFAVMLGLGRLARDSELSVIRASGVPYARIAAPLIALGLVLSGALFVLSDFVVPWATHRSQTIVREIVFGEAMPDIEQDVFFKAPGDRYFYVGSVNRDAGVVERVMIYEANYASFPRLVTAKRGRIEKGTWVLEKGSVHELDSSGQVAMAIGFESMKVAMDSTMEGFTSSQKEPSEMSRAELRQNITLFEKSGIKVYALSVAYHLKLAQPMAALVFAVIGAPLVTKSPRHGGGYFGVVAASLLALLYFIVTAVCRSFGSKGTIAPITAAWLPNAIFLAAGILLLARAEGKALRFGRRGGPKGPSLLIVLIAVCGVLFAVSPDVGAESIPVEVHANSLTYDDGTGIWTVLGDVEIVFKSTVIRGREAQVDVNTGMAIVRGSVVVVQGDEKFTGEVVSFDMSSGDVRLEQAWAKLKDERIQGSLYITGSALARQDSDVHIEQGTVTTCDLESPHYHLEVESLDYYPDDKIVLHRVSYYEGSVRLLTIPRLTLPLKEDERFQMPKIGYGAVEGWYIKGQYNYVLNPGSSGSLHLDYYQLLGPAIGLTHRLKRNDASMSIYVYELFNRSTDSGDTTLQLTGDVTLPLGISAKAGFSYRDFSSFQVLSTENVYTLSLERKIDGSSSSISFSKRDLSSAMDSSLITTTFKHSSTLAGTIKLTTDGSYRFHEVGGEVKQNALNYKVNASASAGKLGFAAVMQEQVYIEDESKPQDEKPPPWKALRRTPELTATLSKVQIGEGPLSVGGKLLFGVYKEDAIRDGARAEVVSAKSEVDLTLSLATQNIAPWLTADASARAVGSAYSVDALRGALGFTVGATAKPVKQVQLRLAYNLMEVVGSSPFKFDSMGESHSVTAALTSQVGPVKLNLSSGFNLRTETPDPLSASASVELAKGVTLEASGKYNIATNTPTTATARLIAAPKPEFQLKAGASYDFARAGITRVETSADVRLSPEWRVQWAAVYDLVRGGLVRGDVGITRDLHCREVGLTYQYTTGRVWLEFRLKALPTSPLSFGLGDEGVILSK